LGNYVGNDLHAWKCISYDAYLIGNDVSVAPKPVPRRRTSPGVPKRSAPCPPGSSSPSHRESPRRPRTPDFESPKLPTRRINKQRPLTMARSINVDVGDHMIRSNTMAVPRPRKRGQAVSMVMDCTQIDLEIEELQSKLAVSVSSVILLYVCVMCSVCNVNLLSNLWMLSKKVFIQQGQRPNWG